jgi:hypothetical protein
MKKMTLTEMKQANKAINHHWFSRGAMEFFNTRIVSQPNKFNMFITSEQMNENVPIGYAIRFFNSTTSKVETIGDMQQFATLEDATNTRKIISNGFEKMSNREKWIIDNLSSVEFTPDWITFTAYDDNEKEQHFDISYDGNICG